MTSPDVIDLDRVCLATWQYLYDASDNEIAPGHNLREALKRVRAEAAAPPAEPDNEVVAVTFEQEKQAAESSLASARALLAATRDIAVTQSLDGWREWRERRDAWLSSTPAPAAAPCAGCAARDAALLESVELLSDTLTSSEPRAAARRALSALRAARSGGNAT